MEAGTARAQQPRCRTRQPAWRNAACTAYLPAFQGKRGEVVHGGHGSCRPVGVPGPDRETDTGWDGAITIHQACVLLRQASSSSHPPRTIFLSRFYYSVFVN